MTVEDLGDDHNEEGLGQGGAAQVDVGEQGNAELHHVGAKDLTLAGALQGHSQGGGGGHGANGGQIGGAIVLHHLNAVVAGVGASNAIEDGHPDVVTGHDDDDGQQESGELLGDGAVIAETAEGEGDKEG